ncbi:MAG: multitransmembrane protein [Ferroplasma sp. Type II]|jgi:hypothetical protein|uniref:thermopsin family protease n=1 Tax=Ferroplasma sp. Type II TaxID=261388 RepID=UPI0003894F43|nr:thermopsin family protease [Ferroplasma sp. Type II]EQB73972.1 MAG: multitransmembrane protein [Ferroplasma sp. Type II]
MVNISKKFIVILVVMIAVSGFSFAVVFGQQGNFSSTAVQGKSVPGIAGSSSNTKTTSVPSQFSKYQNSFNSSVSKLLGKDGVNGKNLTSRSSYFLNSTGNSSIINHLFIPNKHAANFYKMVNNTVTPLYSSAPAPNGIGDFGVKNVSGNLVGYNYNTSSFEGTVSLNSLSPLYLLNDAPHTVTIQLNTVLNNVTLFGKSDYSFWTQNVIVYSARTHTLSLEDNLWNFSSPAAYLTSNAIYNSTGNVLPYSGVHIALGPNFTINQPFTVHLYLNSTLLHNRNVVYFNYSIPQISMSGTYDRVTFNSTYGMPSSYKTPQANFLVSGTHVTPTGYLLYDAELMIGGPGGGSTTDIYGINGSMSLKYMNSTSGNYQNVPSAYNFGTDTGETSSGVSIYWKTNDVAYLNAGPSILRGMWGIQNDPGAITVSGSIAPSNGFLFINSGNAVNNTTTQWSPVPQNGKFIYYLSPGDYAGQVLASDYQPMYNILVSDHSGGSSVGLGSIDLVHNVSYGGYTPLFAFNNAQLLNITISGKGTSASPYILINQNVSIDPVFGQLNDFGFPVFPGVFLKGTTDYVSTLGEQQAITDNSVYGTFIGYNTMPYFIYNSQNVSVLAMDISGTLYPSMYGFIAGELTFWNSSNDIISESCFINTYVGIAFNSSMDITAIHNKFISTDVYSAYGNANIANNIFYDGSGIVDYYSNDSLVGNFFYQSSADLSYFAHTYMRGNTFFGGSYLEGLNSSLTGDYDQFNSSDIMLLNSTLYLSSTGIGNSYVVLADSISYLSNSTVNESEVASFHGTTHLNTTVIYNSFLGSLGANVSLNSDSTWYSFYESLSSNWSILSTHEIDPSYIAEMGNISFKDSSENGIWYEALESNTSVVSSTISVGPYSVGPYSVYTQSPYPWFMMTFYGSNNFKHDNVTTKNFTMNKTYYTYYSTVLPNLNSLVFNEGTNVVDGTNISTMNGNQASNLILEYGTNNIINNAFTSNNVSLNGNLYGAGSSLIVYGGVNVISHNTFITINSPAASSLLKYGDASSGQSTFLYSVTFKESGLPSGTQWTLDFNGTNYSTSKSSYSLLVSPGNYSYSASSPGFVAVNGKVSVVSSSVSVSIPFVAEQKYLVTFTEKGLPLGTSWTVNLNGKNMSSNGNSVSFMMYNGTFDYTIMQVSGYHSSPTTGSVTVNGSNVNESVSWYPVNYTVTFSETGLSPGTIWGLSVNGVVHTSSTNNITLSLPNGTYSYSLTTVSGYTPHAYTGSFTINSSSTTINIAYTPNTYTVVFIETGLPSGTTWNVTFNGVLKTTNSTSISFTNVTDGTYSYTVDSHTGYFYTHSGSVAVSNSGASIPLSFVKSVTQPSSVIPIVAGVVAGIAASIAGSVGVLFFIKKH